MLEKGYFHGRSSLRIKRKKGIPSVTKSPSGKHAEATLHAVTSLEPLNPAGSVNQLLFAGEERVAGRADLGIYLRFCRTGFKGVAAETLDGNIDIFGVDSFSHFLIPPINAGKSPIYLNRKV
jgi:hypothetical protein